MEKLALTPKDVGAALGIGTNAAYALCHSAGFPAIRVGQRRIVIPTEAFRRWLDEQANNATIETDASGR